MQGSGEVVHVAGASAAIGSAGFAAPFGQRRNGANLRRPYGLAEQGLSKAAMVALRGGSSNQTSRFSRLADALPTLLGRRLRSRHVRVRQVQRRLTPKEIEQLLTEYRAGDSMQELARKLRLHRTTVTEHLRRSSIAVRHRGDSDREARRSDPAQRRRMVLPTAGRALSLRR
jgi:DNA-binding CsgD family transcriptional regulator